MPKVLITDYAWPDLEIEKEILSAAGIECVVADATDEASLISAAADVDAIMTNWANTTSKVIGASGKAKIVSRMGIGLDNIDIPFCTANSIPVTNVPDYCLIEVAEHAIASILALGRKIAFYHHQTQQGIYELQSGPALRRLEGQTLGIVGLGNIGQRIAQKAKALGLNVVASVNRSKPEIEGIEIVSFEELLAQSDFVSINAPLNESTKHLFSTSAFKLMKPTAYLINTARGGLVDHEALAIALAEGQLAGAALDVQDPEPPNLNISPYNDAKVLVTPHAAFVSQESLENLRSRSAKQVVDRLAGKVPENVVNPEVL